VKHLPIVLLFAGLLSAQTSDPAAWRPLFDGKTLSNWRESDFFGAGKVTVENQTITLGFGALTGITWSAPTLPFPAAGYELRLEAMRVKGSDFFAGITFPVRDSYCTWIVGGWGGDVVGLSSIDGIDAAHNETSFSQKFDLGRWYDLRLRVTPARITAWMDSDQVIDIAIADRRISLREGEIEHSAPLGIASYSTVARLRRIEWRPATPK
jgi:hypothetical protein